LLLLSIRRVVFVDQRLQLLRGVKGHDSARGDGDFFAGFRIAPGTLWLVAELEVAETRQLDALAALQRGAHLLEKGLDHILGFTLVEAHFLKQDIGQLCLGEGTPAGLGPLQVLVVIEILGGRRDEVRVRMHFDHSPNCSAIAFRALLDRQP
jgi:hypothetical protein